MSVEPLGRVAATDIDATLIEAGVESAPPSRSGVELYRLEYSTVTPSGESTTASGLVSLPEDAEGRLTVAAYLHGTIASKTDAPSVAESADRALTAAFAGAGLVGVAPDYLGLGLGSGAHPYLDMATEVTASADLLVATRTFVDDYGVTLRPEVLLSGFSQGGRVALALARSLDLGEVSGFQAGAVDSVSGPYDLGGTELPAVFDGRVNSSSATFYIAYLVTAWNRTVGLYDDPREAFAEPFAGTIEGLFDGTRSSDDIVAGLPDAPEKLFTPAFLEQLVAPTGAFLEALRTDDALCGSWTPSGEVELYVGAADTDVVPVNADRCAEAFAAAGVTATVTSTGNTDHNGTALAAYSDILGEYAQIG